MSHIKGFKDLSKQDVAIAGGKGASLGEMTKAGIPVPPGFVVLSSAFERFLEETDLNVELDAILHRVNHNEVHTVERASEEIKALILAQEMPQDLKKDILREFKSLNSPFVAVRSSATSEDSSTAAWAGQLDSFLNTTEASLLENVKHCWASLFTPRAIVYRFEKDLHKQKISVAVVVQKMVQSEVSGIAFSVHPVTQDYNQLIIEAGFGLGEAIVSGQITPDSYVVEKQPRRIIDINVNEQDRGLYKKSSGGNEWHDLGQKGNQQVLTEKQIQELSDLILKIEKHYGFPCDIEWAFESNKFYIVQSRPITTLTDKQEFNGFQENKKIILKELAHLDTPLSFVELHSQEEPRDKLLWSKNVFERKPIIIAERKEDQTYFYYDIKWMEWIRQQAGAINDESSALKKIKETYDKIKDTLEKEKALSRKELNDFLKNVRNTWTWLNYMWFGIEYKEQNGQKFDNLMEMRKYTEYFVPGMFAVLRNSIKKIYPQFKEYADFILLSEVENNRLPRIQVLKKRRKHYVYSSGKLYDSMADIKEFDFEIQEDEVNDLSGQTAFPGKVKGVVRIINRRDDVKDFRKGEILVASTTTPDYLPAMKKAGAIISEHGGAICHAAITSRELKIPCVVGVKGATKVLQDGDLVEVDADKGIIHILNKENNLSNVNQKEWIKNYEGKFSLFFNSLGLDLPPLKEYLGVTLDNALVLYKDGVATGNFVKSELDNFSKTLAERAKKNPAFLLELSQGLKKSTDEIMKILSQDPKVFLKKEKFSELHKAFNKFSAFSMGVKETINALDYKLVEKYGNNLEESRKYSEKVFFTISDVCGKMLEHVARKEKISKEQAESLIVPEFEEYLKNGKIPPSQELSERYKSSVLLVMPNQKIIIGKEAEEIDKELHKFEGNILQGTTAYLGKVNGLVRVIKKFSPDSNIKEGDILVTGMTDPRFVPLMKKAKAIITDAGGMLCHAAIISRELKIPCIIGTRIATRILKDGNRIEVNASEGAGTITIINSEPIKMINLQSREHSLFYCYVWQQANQIYSKDFFQNVKNVIFICNKKNAKVQVWYSEQELEEIYEYCGIKARDKKWFDYVKREFWKYHNKLIPYCEGKKKINSLKELKQFYDDWVAWWAPMAVLFVLPESKTALKEISDEALKIRAETEKYSDSGDRVVLEAFTRLKPQYKDIADLIIPEEMFNCDKLSPEDVRNIERRSLGFVIFNGKLTDPSALDSLLKANNLELEKLEARDVKEIKGSPASPGKVKGKVRVIHSKKDFHNFRKGEILVTEMTSPDYVPIMKKSLAIVTDEGGRMCHAAIVSRELKIPCIVGTKNATHVLKDGDLVEVDANTGVVQILEKASSSGKKEFDPENYFFLENVPGGYPLDVTDINLWHLAAPKIEGFSFDAGSMFLIFEGGNYDLFMERDKWFSAAKKILSHTLESEERIKEWEIRIQKWISDLVVLNNHYAYIDFKSMSDEDLLKSFDSIIELIKRNGQEDVEIVTPNYGTNLIVQELTQALKELSYNPSQISSILFRSSKDFPLLEYEREIANLALYCYNAKIKSLVPKILQKDNKIRLKIKEILEKYAWLDASIVNPPKSEHTVIQDVNNLLDLKERLTQTIKDRELEQKNKRYEKEKLLKEILVKSNPFQKRSVEFAVKSAEYGRMVVDGIMEFIYHSRKIHSELAQRLNLSEIELKLLLSEEVKEHISQKKKVDTTIIKERKKLAVCFLNDEKIEVYTGKKAEEIKNSLHTLKTGDSSPLKGEIAFSKGIVKGTAKLVKNNKEMSKVQHGDILVSSRTYPDLLPAMKKSAAIIAELGGLLSHAAIVSRELHIPCLVGVKNAMTKIKDGDLLEIDTDKGKIAILKKA